MSWWISDPRLVSQIHILVDLRSTSCVSDLLVDLKSTSCVSDPRLVSQIHVLRLRSTTSCFSDSHLVSQIHVLVDVRSTSWWILETTLQCFSTNMDMADLIKCPEWVLTLDNSTHYKISCSNLLVLLRFSMRLLLGSTKNGSLVTTLQCFSTNMNIGQIAHGHVLAAGDLWPCPGSVQP